MGRHTGTKSLQNTTYRVTELRELAIFIINNEINVFCIRNTVCSLHSKVPLSYHSRPHFLVFKVDWFQVKTVKPGQNSLRPADQSQGHRDGLGMTGSPAPSSVSGLMAAGRRNYAPTRHAGAVENTHPGAHLALAQSQTPSRPVPTGCLRPVTTSLLSPLPTCSVHPTSSSDPAVSPGPPPLEPQLLDSGTAAS